MSRGAADRVTLTDHGTLNRKIIGIGVPSLGTVSLYFAARLVQLRMPMNTIARWFFLKGREVGEARNEITTRALEAGVSHLLFLDDDVLFHPDALIRLLSHNRPMVGGLYYSKQVQAEPLAFGPEHTGVVTGWQHGDVVDVSAVSMGLTLIEGGILNMLAEHAPLDANGHPGLFTTTRDGRTPSGILNETEDVAFCRLVRETHTPIALDTHPHAFGFHFDGIRGYPLEQWTQFMAGERVTWPHQRPGGGW